MPGNTTRLRRPLRSLLTLCGLFTLAPLVLASPGARLAEFGYEFKFAYPQTPTTNSVIFGVSVALSGDTALVGAMNDQGPNGAQGAAYVLVRSGNTWVQQARLSASDVPAGSYFGHSVALSGDTALIGAPGGDGLAYIFVRTGTSWTQQAQLTPTEGSIGEQFGYAVALSGDTALIGVPSDDLGDSFGHGSAFVFTRTGDTWSQQQKLIASDFEPINYFGSAVALEGDTGVIGAPYDSFGNNALQGSAYVFTRSGVVWTEQAKLFAADGAASDQFGSALAVSGNTLAVGAFLDDVNGQANQGSVHVFMRNGSSWPLQAQLLMAGGEADDQLGLGVTLQGDTLLAGARLDTVTSFHQGSVVVYTRDGSNWTQGQKITASDANTQDAYGHSLAMSGDQLIVGAYNDEPPGAPSSTDSGSVYLYAEVPPPQADLQLTLSNMQTHLVPGQPTTYELLVSNAGPSAVDTANLSNVVPAELNSVQWTCSTVTGTANCPNAQGSGNDIAQTLQLPAGSMLRYQVSATVAASPGAVITNTTTVTAAAPVVDTNLGNNSASDQDLVVADGLFADGFE